MWATIVTLLTLHKYWTDYSTSVTRCLYGWHIWLPTPIAVYYKSVRLKP